LNTEAEGDMAEDNQPKNLMCWSSNCQNAKIPTRWLWKNGSRFNKDSCERMVQQRWLWKNGSTKM